MERVLQIGFSDNPGGVENVVLNYYREIVKKGIQFDFVDLYGNDIAYKNEILCLGGRIYSTANYKTNPIKAYRQLCSFIRKNNYKCIHVHMQSAANLLPIIAGIRSGCTVIAHSHSSSTPTGLARKLLHSFNVHILRLLNIEKYACGTVAGEWMWGHKFDQEHIIPNATDLSKFAYDNDARNRIRNAINFEDCFIIGFVGRFGEEKNTLFLIDVLEQLLNRNPSTRLVTVGGNDLFDSFYEEIQRRGLGKYYYSAGIQNDTSQWYQVFDAFLMPSFFEGFPLVALEAQAAGLPCYLSDHITSEIALSENVFFIPIGSSDSSLEWSNTILHNTQVDRSALSNSLLEYDISHAVDKLISVYSKAFECE